MKGTLREGGIPLKTYEELLQEYKTRAGFYACAVPVFEQLVLASLLNSGDFERHIRRIRRKLRNTQEKESTDS